MVEDVACLLPRHNLLEPLNTIKLGMQVSPERSNCFISHATSRHGPQAETPKRCPCQLEGNGSVHGRIPQQRRSSLSHAQEKRPWSGDMRLEAWAQGSTNEAKYAGNGARGKLTR